MIIAVIDGMGGGIGSQVVHALRDELPSSIDIYALGTNAIATSAMMKQKANKGATGENAIRVSSKNANIIICPFSLLIPDSMMGEVTLSISESITQSDAYKIILPILPENYSVIGLEEKPLLLMIKDAIDIIKKEFSIK